MSESSGPWDVTAIGQVAGSYIYAVTVISPQVPLKWQKCSTSLNPREIFPNYCNGLPLYNRCTNNRRLWAISTVRCLAVVCTSSNWPCSCIRRRRMCATGKDRNRNTHDPGWEQLKVNWNQTFQIRLFRSSPELNLKSTLLTRVVGCRTVR